MSKDDFESGIVELNTPDAVRVVRVRAKEFMKIGREFRREMEAGPSFSLGQFLQDIYARLAEKQMSKDDDDPLSGLKNAPMFHVPIELPLCVARVLLSPFYVDKKGRCTLKDDDILEMLEGAEGMALQQELTLAAMLGDAVLNNVLVTSAELAEEKEERGEAGRPTDGDPLSGRALSENQSANSQSLPAELESSPTSSGVATMTPPA